MRFRLGVLVASVAAGALWFPTAAGAASTHAAPTVTCGMAVSTSITLTHDLNCPGTALSVQNDGRAPISLTIDLGGHTVSSASGAAIEARDKSVTMTLQNGRIVGNGESQSVEDEGRSNVYQHLIFDRGWIVSVNDAAPRILHSWFIHGAFVFTDQNSADVEHNVFTAEGGSSGFDPDSSAIALFSTHSTVIGNVVIGYGTGIVVSDDLGSADIRGNTLVRNGMGIRIAGPRLPATITRNVAIANRGDGIVIGDGTRSEVTGNSTLLNGGDGIRIDSSPLFTGAPSFGIIATLSRNVSLANVRWGIEAPPASSSVAVIDGGRNVVHFNGAGQCRNFPCSRSRFGQRFGRGSDF